MPELPEVETVRRTLAPILVGATLLDVQVRDTRLRAPVDTARLRRLLVGRRVLALRRRGKYLLADVTGDVVLLFHLGMTGRLVLGEASRPLARHDHLVFTLSGERQLRFNDARRFGLVEAFPAAEEVAHPRLVGLGLEPLAASFSGDHLFAMTRRSRQPMKTFIMDARHVVGVGNIYASESLFLAGIHPGRAARQLSKSQAAALVQAIQSVLTRAIACGGTTLRDFANGLGVAGEFSVELQVYGREGHACPRCGHAIRRLVQGGRSTFYCPRCQRRRA